MPVWPSALPAYPLTEHYAETMGETSLRTEMEAGPAKVRRRTTAAVRRFALGYLLNKTEVSALETFYHDTLEGGTLRFDFTHPRTGSTVACRFASPPHYKTANGEYYHVRIELEVLP